MEKEILKAILERFDNFKNEQLIFLLVAFIVFLMISIFQTVYSSRLIDKFKNELKKKEMKFSLYNELQIKTLSQLYNLASELKSANASIHNGIEKTEEPISGIDNWNLRYKEFTDYFDSSKYIIPKPQKELFKDFYNDLIDFNCNINLLNERRKILNKNGKKSLADKKDIEVIDKEISSFNFKVKSLETLLFTEKLKNEIERYFEQLE